MHDSFADFLESANPARIFLVETGGDSFYSEVSYQANDFFVFGSETKGLDPELLQDYRENIITLPQKNVRSLNLSNTVSIVIYEAWRQLAFVDVKNLF